MAFIAGFVCGFGSCIALVVYLMSLVPKEAGIVTKPIIKSRQKRVPKAISDAELFKREQSQPPKDPEPLPHRYYGDR